jgi:hypothetical protein
MPFSTFGDIAALGSEVHAYSAGYKTHRQLAPDYARIRDR